MCGGPRIPAGFGGDGATKALREQREALATARLASVATVIQGIVSAMVTLLALAIAPASIVGKVLLFSLAVFPLVLAMRSRVRATKARRRARAAAERAWLAAAEDVAARDARGTTSSALAEALGVDVARADELLTALAVHDRTRIDVDDDAEVRYSVSRAPLVRVGSEPPEPAEEDLERAGAEERQDRREGRAR